MILPVAVVGEIPTRTRANFSVLMFFIIDSTPLCPPEDLLKEAKENIKEAIELHLECLAEDGIPISAKENSKITEVQVSI